MNFTGLIQTTINALRQNAALNNNELQCFISKNVNSNLDENAKIITNICYNAIAHVIKHTKNGQIFIEIDQKRAFNPFTRSIIIINISYNGDPLTNFKLGLIWDRHVNSEPQQNNISINNHLNIGLVIKYVNDLSGTVELKGNKDFGNTIRIEIPIKTNVKYTKKPPKLPIKISVASHIANFIKIIYRYANEFQFETFWILKHEEYFNKHNSYSGFLFIDESIFQKLSFDLTHRNDFKHIAIITQNQTSFLDSKYKYVSSQLWREDFKGALGI